MNYELLPRILGILFISMLMSSVVISQQVADSAFVFPIENPAYAFGTGPVITIDEAHSNFHTLNGR